MGLMQPQLPCLAVLATVRSLLLWARHLPMATAVGGVAEGRIRPPLTWSTSRVRKVAATSSAAWRLARLQARVAQEREHGRDTAVHLLLAGQVQLGEDRVDVLLD